MLFWGTIVETELTFLEEQVKVFAWDAVVFAQHALGLVPEVFNAVDVMAAFGARGLFCTYRA